MLSFCHTSLIVIIAWLDVKTLFWETLNVTFRNLLCNSLDKSHTMPDPIEIFTGNQQAVTLFLLHKSTTLHPIQVFHVLRLLPNAKCFRNMTTRSYVCTVHGCQANFKVKSTPDHFSNSCRRNHGAKFVVEIMRQHDYSMAVNTDPVSVSNSSVSLRAGKCNVIL